MPYEVLEKQIRALPETAQLEVAHYVGYLYALYTGKTRDASISARINAFMQENPSAFDEFAPVREAGLMTIQELVKDDTW